MNIVVRSRQFKMTDALKDYVTKRVKKLEKYPYDFSDVQVTLTVEKGRQRVEITTLLNGYLLRGEEETLDMYSSVDLVVEKLEKQIKKYRKRFEKRRESLRDMEILPEGSVHGATNGADTVAAAAAMSADAAGDEAVERDNVVRVKKILAKPMTVDEAVMQMNMIGHSFYMFVNAESGQMNVVYGRNDGNYGLLEPER
ncbi:MAG: ribosome-associated translation inhibitor RaiA [Gracilibacteraceae bacterium]|jgi:putative sigma-54 modulation protein|nr:ribosome-associated translation inhibitor RaiA [Gracilibacteraceae bacterium]